MGVTHLVHTHRRADAEHHLIGPMICTTTALRGGETEAAALSWSLGARGETETFQKHQHQGRGRHRTRYVGVLYIKTLLGNKLGLGLYLSFV